MDITNKKLFEEFLNKIYLNGEVDSCIIDLKKDSMSTHVFIQHRMFGMNVEMNHNIFEGDFSDIEIPIVNLETLYKIMKSFPEDCTIDLKGKGTYVNDTSLHHMEIKNDLLNSNFILGKRAGVDNKRTIDMSKIDNWLFTFNFTEFNETYRKYQNILKDYETFYFSNKNGEVQLNFGGLRKTSENSITVNLGFKPSSEFNKSILFNKDIFNAILNSNREADINVHVNNTMYMITCEEENIKSKYFNTKTKNQ